VNVFFPFKKNPNKYLDEIESHFKGNFFYGGLDEYNDTFNIVSIHWPEAIFNWEEPSDEQLFFLEKKINYWKIKSKIIITVHNKYPHYRNTIQFKKLYDLLYSKSNGFIHLGKYSFNMFEDKFKNSNHAVIKHPLYTTLNNSLSRMQARKKLHINEKAKVILVFGAIRSSEEVEIINLAFKKLNHKNKLLLVPRMRYFFIENYPKILRKSLIKVIMCINKIRQRKIYYSNFVQNENIEVFFKACDVVFVVRKNSLNSGNIFLANTFNKVVLGPDIGNISESLDNLGYPTYNPNDINSIVEALEKAFLIIENGAVITRLSKKFEENKPLFVAKEYYNFFKLNINNGV